MPGKREAYGARIEAGEDPEAIALTESGLPGPRGNLELVGALGDVASAEALIRWASLGPEAVGGDEPRTVLVVGGLDGLGRLLAEGRSDVLPLLRMRAGDPRWRVREGVAMALQRWADHDAAAAFDLAGRWAADDPYLQRAAVAGVCEPRLLKAAPMAARAVRLLDDVTASLAARSERRSDDVIALRKALGYGWSVAIVAAPEVGRPAFERWLGESDPDVRWIVRENLRKDRLRRMDAAWVEACLARK